MIFQTKYSFTSIVQLADQWEFFPWIDGSFPFQSTAFPIPSHSHSQTGLLFQFPWYFHGNWESHSHGHL